MTQAILEDLAFTNYSSRESDEVGSEDMCEHGMKARAVLMVAERYLVVSINKRAEFRRTEKNIERDSLKNRINGWGGGVLNLTGARASINDLIQG